MDYFRSETCESKNGIKRKREERLPAGMVIQRTKRTDLLRNWTDSSFRELQEPDLAISGFFSSIQRWMNSGRGVEMLIMVEERRDDDGSVMIL